MKLLQLVPVLAMLATACGPGGRDRNGDDGVDGASCSAEVCNDGIDNDCDLRADCSDPDCSGKDGCPVCGSVENPEGSPLALPDGVSSGAMCSTDAQCTAAATPNCVAKECHASYTSTLKFIGFPMNATLTDPSKLLSVCLEVEHSWLRDLQIELIPPNGQVFVLDKFVDRAGGEVYLGQANDNDTAATPVPGVGALYCWKPLGPTLMVTSATQNGPVQDFMGHEELVPGDYQTATPWTAIAGAPLNGMWTIRVTDLWAEDNGFIFKWSIAFDPTLVTDCSGPIIE